MSTKNPESPSNIPADEPLTPAGKNRPEPAASSIHYVRIKEPKVPVPIFLIGLGVIAAAIIAFLHYHGT